MPTRSTGKLLRAVGFCKGDKGCSVGHSRHLVQISLKLSSQKSHSQKADDPLDSIRPLANNGASGVRGACRPSTEDGVSDGPEEPVRQTVNARKVRRRLGAGTERLGDGVSSDVESYFIFLKHLRLLLFYERERHALKDYDRICR